MSDGHLFDVLIFFINCLIGMRTTAQFISWLPTDKLSCRCLVFSSANSTFQTVNIPAFTIEFLA